MPRKAPLRLILLNLALLVLLGALSYGLTVQLDHQPPPIIMQPDAPLENVDEGQSLPDFTVKTHDGKTIRAHDFAGKVIVLNFWASWCAPCVKEFPVLLQAAADHPDEMVLIALSSDIDAASMNQFLQKQNLQIDAPNVFIALDDQDNLTQSVFQTYKLPETIIIDPQLKMRHKLIGADWDYETLATLIKDYAVQP